ncbi:ATP-binding protein [Sphingomonas sp. CFBP 13706]|uniref:ATP-binding protein n=1 Tax=Sphingomonas sp. CFBP 13706 TaxID=2775314 RepID=UPI001786FD8C|nr:ATP-binding protein [Sphingomonas sp. CFBP 13706]MBD8736232.1 ATP-binding protein [Sphingomonas sp. CFBP 13706]
MARTDLTPVSPLTGSARPDYETNGERTAHAVRLMLDLYVPTAKQEALISKVNAFTNACSGMSGVPLPGRALSEPSQAGKSRTIAEMARRLNAVTPCNPRRVIHLELTERITVKMLYQRILVKLGDPEALGRYSVEILRQRCAELLPAVGTNLLAIDEIQLLGKLTNDNYEVADALKSMLDTGIVPILFSGNEKAKNIFEVNEQLRGRLGVPLELMPVNPRLLADRKALKTFADALDVAITASGLVSPSGLGESQVLRQLGKAAGGYTGRFCRIVGAALEHACARGAERIEPYDLSHAVRHLAIPARWVGKNPFPEPDRW